MTSGRRAPPRGGRRKEGAELQPASSPIRVLLVDDHAVVLRGLRAFLKVHPDIEVVGEAENGAEALRLAETLRPDVVLIDLVMPVMDGPTAIRAIRERHPEVRVIALTSFAAADQVIPAVRAGAQGYLLKDVKPLDLVAAIRAVHRGEVHLHPDATRQLLQQVAEPGPQALVETLTPREMQVLEGIARGRSNKEIAADLGIQEKTVKSHASNLFAKLGVADRTQAALFAVRHGLVRLDA